MTTTTYVIRVRGHLDDHWSGRLGGLAVTRHPDGATTLTGPVTDQAQLHGVLHGLRDIGVDLIGLDSRAVGLQPALAHPLTTARLTLRAATTEDAASTWRFRRHQQVNGWLTGCAADLAGYRDQFSQPARLAGTVIITLGHGPAGPVIGDFMIGRTDACAQLDVAERAAGPQAELAWVLDPAHAGNGYTTEAARELLRHCFEDLRVRRVTAKCFLDDDSSWRLMERLGMRREAHAIRESLHPSGDWLDTVGYAILEEEWSSD